MPQPDHSDLPVPAESTRSYLRVRPTEDQLGADAVKKHFQQLHQFDQRDGGLLDGLLNRSAPPTVECLLISEGNDTALHYAFGIDDEDAIEALEHLLRGLFPDTYEIECITRLPEHLTALGTTDGAVAAVEFFGRVERRTDWQTRLTPFETFTDDEESRLPLGTIVETMASHDCPMVYQALLQPKPDWSARADARRVAIEANQDTLFDQVVNAVVGSPEDETSLPPSDESRLAELTDRDARRSFVLNARVVARGEEETTRPAVEALTSAFADVSYTCYDIEGHTSTDKGEDVLTAIHERTLYPPRYDRRSAYLPWRRPRSRGIIVDATEAPNFCLLGGNTLTAAGARAVAPTPGERTALPRPPAEQLRAYRGDGLLLGRPLTQDGNPDAESLVLPPALQPLHVGWFGKTGSGKSTSLINALLTNHAATEGADILIDPKGDGMAEDYCRAHYATYGSLENVIYFDCAAALPAFSFFDIRDELAAGVPRTTAVEDTVDHYVEILTQIMGRERFEQAVRSPDIIRYLVKSMFDPVNGAEAFSHRELHSAVRRMHERQAAPAVADPDLERMLAGVVANRARSFDEIMQGVANRLEKIPVDRRLARIFNHVPEEDDPHFDLAEFLNDDVVIVVDTGELRTEAQRVLTLVILSNLWTALRRRSQRSDGSQPGPQQPQQESEPEQQPQQQAQSQPLVNLYIEEAASIAVSDLLTELLAQSRSFDCSVTLSMQFPAQLGGLHDAVYDEVLNNISTFVAGNVPADRRLAERLTTDEMNPQAVGNRLRALRRGQWLVSLPAAFDEPEPRPFLVGSAPPPPGDADGPDPLAASQAVAFETAMAGVRERTQADVGLTLGSPSAVTRAEEATTEDAEATSVRVDSALPQTNRLPPTVEYAASIHALRCTECDNRYDPDTTGMKRAIACCSSLEETDRDDIPICDLNLKLTPEERAATEWTDHQLMFLQAVYNAQQLRYDPLEYDLLEDSMLRLQEYVGVDSEAIQDLIEVDLLRHDTDHPHRLYTVTPEGRSVIGESYREGVDYGHGAGDLEESSEHVFAVEVARQYLEAEYVENSDSAVAEVVPYYDLDDQHRLDIAGLDSDGEIRVAVEAERVNHDILRAVPTDFDKMAACEPAEAIWVVMTQSDGHAVLEALNDPPEGDPRVEKTYANTTPPQQFRIETPGMTAMYPAEWLRDRLHSTS